MLLHVQDTLESARLSRAQARSLGRLATPLRESAGRVGLWSLEDALVVEEVAAASKTIRGMRLDAGSAAGTPSCVCVHPKMILVGTTASVVMTFDHFGTFRGSLGAARDALAPADEFVDARGVTSMDWMEASDLVVGYGDGRVVLWDVAARTPSRVVPPTPPAKPITMVRWYAPNLSLVTDTSGAVSLLRFSKTLFLTMTFDKRRLVQDPAGVASMAVFSPSAFRLAQDAFAAATAPDALIPSDACLVALATTTHTLLVRLDKEPPIVVFRWTAPPALSANEGVGPSVSWTNTVAPSSSSSAATPTAGKRPTLARGWGRHVEVWQDGRVVASRELEEDTVLVEWLGERFLSVLTDRFVLFVLDASRRSLDVVGRADASRALIACTPIPVSAGNPIRNFQNACRTALESNSDELAQPGARKMYVLGEGELLTARMQAWVQRVDGLCRNGEWIEALGLAARYYKAVLTPALARAEAEAMAVDDEGVSLRATLTAIRDGTKIAQLLTDYLDFALKVPGNANSSSSSSTPAKALTVAAACVEYAVAIDRPDLVSVDVLERFAEKDAVVLGAFVDALEPYLTTGRVTKLSPVALRVIVDDLIRKRRFRELELMALRLDLEGADLDGLIRACRACALFSGLTRVFNDGLGDFVSPATEMMDNAEWDSISSAEPSNISNNNDDGDDEQEETMDVDAFARKQRCENPRRLLLYLKYCFLGVPFPPTPVVDAASMAGFHATTPATPSSSSSSLNVSINANGGERARNDGVAAEPLPVAPPPRKIPTYARGALLRFALEEERAARMLAYDADAFLDTIASAVDAPPPLSTATDSVSADFVMEALWRCSLSAVATTQERVLDFLARYVQRDPRAGFFRSPLSDCVLAHMVVRNTQDDIVGVLERALLDSYDAAELAKAATGLALVSAFFLRAAFERMLLVKTHDEQALREAYTRLVDAAIDANATSNPSALFALLRDHVDSKSSWTREASHACTSVLLARAQRLLALDVNGTCEVLQKAFAADQNELVEALEQAGERDVLYQVLKHIVVSSASAGGGPAPSLHMIKTFVELLCERESDVAAGEWLRENEGAYPLDAALEAALRHKLDDAASFLLDRAGRTEEALEMVLRSASESVARFDALALDEGVRRMEAAAANAVRLCARLSDFASVDDAFEAWFRVLDVFLAAFRGGGSKSATSDARNDAALRVIRVVLRAMVPRVDRGKLVVRLRSSFPAESMDAFERVVQATLGAFRAEQTVVAVAHRVIQGDLLVLEEKKRVEAARGTRVRVGGAVAGVPLLTTASATLAASGTSVATTTRPRRVWTQSHGWGSGVSLRVRGGGEAVASSETPEASAERLWAELEATGTLRPSSFLVGTKFELDSAPPDDFAEALPTEALRGAGVPSALVAAAGATTMGS